MRSLALAIITSMVATSVSALELPVRGLEINTEIKVFHLVEEETSKVTTESELRYTTGRVSAYSSLLNTWYESGHKSGEDFVITKIWEDGNKPTLEFGAEFSANKKITVYGEGTYDLNIEESDDLQVGVKINF